MTKLCQNCKQNFEILPEDLAFYEKVNVPSPTFCSRCRAMRRMAFRNMRHLYARTCDATGAKIFSPVPTDNPMPVYEDRYWNSDKWSALDYGRDYDFSNNFFDQFRSLYSVVPWGTMWSMEKINSDYSITAYSKNCYLCFDAGYDEDSAYSVTLLYSKQCFDCLNLKDCELCYYSLNTNQSYKAFFSKNCTSCVEVWFCRDCIGCTNCFGCSDLRNKSYCLYNEQLSKEVYEARTAGMRLDSWSGIEAARRASEKAWLKVPVKFCHSLQVTDSSGDYIYNGTRLVDCFFVGNAENMRHCQSVIYPPNKDGMDLTSCEGTELCYDTLCTGNGAYRTLSTSECANIRNSSYSINCTNVENIFGCAALRNKSYCILNKQYTKEEYQVLLPKIIQHMNDIPYTDAQGRVYRYGEFFPFDMSSYGYSQTQAFEYFPITEEEAKKMGIRWRVKTERNYVVTKLPRELPDTVDQVEDAILNEVIQCEHETTKKHSFGCNVDCMTAFRLTKQELEFYRQMKLPLPRLCFNCRHVDRVLWRNAPILYKRKCMCDYKIYKNETKHAYHTEGQCPNEFQTTYAPNRPEIVYCEQCYQAEVI